jgi:pimeloyl-ACP methyl ester carboxylesterase
MTHPADKPIHSATIEGVAISKDGTPIGFYRFGSGPALVFVHGSISNHRDWMRVAHLLSPHHTCILMDRRGRGHSRDGHNPYSVEREYEDVAAVLAAAGPNASLAAHSFGAVCALGGAALAPVHRLVLYEPPYPINRLIAGENLAPFREALHANDHDLALAIGMEKFIRLPEEVVAATRSSKAWPHMRGLVKTWLRELEAMDALGSDLSAYRNFTTPTLLLRGSESPENPFQAANHLLEQTLPNAKISTLEGQSHMAMRLVPDVVAARIAAFLAE